MTLLEWLKRWKSRQAQPLEAEDAGEHATREDELDVDPFNPFPEPIIIEITDIIDLHTIAPRDVRRVVEEYLHQAHMRGFRSVRIIHGKGAGVQREIVRGVLKGMPFVKDWTDAPPTAGGWGATVAHLSVKDN